MVFVNKNNDVSPDFAVGLVGDLHFLFPSHKDRQWDTVIVWSPAYIAIVCMGIVYNTNIHISN